MVTFKRKNLSKMVEKIIALMKKNKFMNYLKSLV